MKSNATGKRFPRTKKEWDEVMRQAPERVPYPETDPYDPNDPAQVEAFWKDPIVSHSYEDLKQQLAERRKRGERGAQKAPTKIATSLRLSPEVIAHFRATGANWQTRIDEVLRRYVKRRASRT